LEGGGKITSSEVGNQDMAVVHHNSFSSLGIWDGKADKGGRDRTGVSVLTHEGLEEWRLKGTAKNLRGRKSRTPSR